MDKKTVLAIIISIAIMSGYQLYMAKKYPQMFKPSQKMQQMPFKSAKTHSSQLIENKRVAKNDTVYDTVYDTVKVKKTNLETDLLKVGFTNRGGAIDSIFLKKYQGPNGDKFATLVKELKEGEGILSIMGAGLTVPLNNVVFKVKDKGPNYVVYSYTVPERLEVTKYFTINPSDYTIALKVLFKNLYAQPQQYEYKLVGGTRVFKESKIDNRYIESRSYINGKLESAKMRKIKNGNYYRKGIVSWIALSGKYFSMILHPHNEVDGAFAEPIKGNNMLTGIKTRQFEIPENGVISHKYTLYAGPNDKKMLAAANMEFEKILNYGWLSGINKILVFTLGILYNLFHNYGLAIIVLSALIGLVTYPLTSKSVVAMQKMQKIQPHLEKLKQEHKSNPQKLNQEIMALYKEHGVNPMGGCLPLFFQMPIFFSLYQTLLRSIELRGAKFLWIKDLSGPDAIIIFKNRLPVIGNSINLLPLLMMGAMFIQQKISAASTTHSQQGHEQQKMMAIVMPVMFGVIFYNFPSGLVLYWLTNTLMMTFFHWRLKRIHG